VDACPNLNAIAKVPSCPIAEPKGSAKPIDDHETEISGSILSSASRKLLSRSLNLDRSSRISSREIREQPKGRDLRAVDRLSRTRTTRISDEKTSRQFRESRFGAARSRDIRNSFDITRSPDLSNRAVDHHYADYRSQNFQHHLADRTSYRLEDRRSRSTERRELNEARRQDRVGRLMDSRNIQRHVSVDRDRRSLSMERRSLSEINPHESIRKISRDRNLARDRADRRSEMREGRALRSERDAERSRREDRRDLNHPARIARGNIDRNNNLDRRNRERSIETRRALVDRVTNQIRRSSIRDSRDLRFNNDRTLTRSLERLSANDLPREILSRRVKSVESSVERFSDRRLSAERRSLRSVERREINLERREDGNHRRFHNRGFLDRTSRVLPVDYHRSISHSRGVISQRDSHENRIGKNPRTALMRSHYDHEEIANRERREILVRSSRSVDPNRLDRQFVRIRDLKDHGRKLLDLSITRRDSSLKRQERTDHLRRSHEEQRIVPQNSREDQRIIRQRSREEQRIVPQRSREEQRIVPQRSREEQRIVRQRSREEQRIVRQRSREEKRIVPQRSREEQRVVPQRSREEQRIVPQRSREEERIVPQRSRETERRLSERISERRFSERRVIADPARLASRRSSERRIDDSLRSHDESRMIDRRLERSPESRVSRDRGSSERRIDDNLKSRERSKIVDHRFEQSRKLQIRFDARRDSHIRSQKEHATRSIEVRDKELVRQQRQISANLNNVREPSELVSSQRITRASRISNQIRKQPKLSADRTFPRTADNNRSFAKWGRNLQSNGITWNMKTWMETESLETYEFLKYSTNYDFMKQAFLVALCTIYGFSLYDGKKSNIG